MLAVSRPVAAHVVRERVLLPPSPDPPPEKSASPRIDAGLRQGPTTDGCAHKAPQSPALVTWFGRWVLLVGVIIAAAPLPIITLVGVAEPEYVGDSIRYLYGFGWVISGIPALLLASALVLWASTRRRLHLWPDIAVAVGTGMGLGAIAPTIYAALMGWEFNGLLAFVGTIGGSVSAACAAFLLTRMMAQDRHQGASQDDC